MTKENQRRPPTSFKGAASARNQQRRRKRGRMYTMLACRKDDPSDLYGVVSCYFRSRKVAVAVKSACGLALMRQGLDMQAKWNLVSGFARKLAARGLTKRKVRHVSRPPSLPDFKGTCYYAMEKSVDGMFDKMYVGDLADDGDCRRLARVKRATPEDFRFFASRLWSKSCPIELDPDEDRRAKTAAWGRGTDAYNDGRFIRFSVRKDFDFMGGRAASASVARRDHEPGPVESEARGGGHKPVNPVAASVNVLRSAGIQNPTPEEMRKGGSLKRSRAEGDARAPVRNSESAALSEVSASGDGGAVHPPILGSEAGTTGGKARG